MQFCGRLSFMFAIQITIKTGKIYNYTIGLVVAMGMVHIILEQIFVLFLKNQKEQYITMYIGIYLKRLK